jgi:hypothetical protein
MYVTRQQLIGANWMFRYRAKRWAWTAYSLEGDVLSLSKTYHPSLLSAVSDARENGFVSTSEQVC